MEKALKKSILNFYGIPSLGFQMFVSMEIFYFAVFLTDFAKIPVALVATILLFTSIADIASVPIAGAILQKSNMKWGKYRSWLLVGPLVAAAFFILQFTKFSDPMVNVVTISIGFIASHLIWNTYYAAHIAMNNSLTTVREERISMSTNRGMFTSIGTIIFSYFGLKVITFFGQSNPVLGYTYTVILTGLIMTACYWTLFVITKDYAHKGIKVDTKENKLTIKEMLKQIVVNPPLMGLMLAEFGRYLGRFIVFAMAFYYFKYVVNNLAVLAILFTGLNVVTLLGSFIANPLAKKFGERKVYITALTIFMCGLLAIYFIPQTSTSFIAIMFVAYLGYGIPDALGVAMYSSTVDYAEWKTGKNAGGFIMSLINFPIKTAIFVRSLIITSVLVSAGYVADMAATPGLISGIRTGIALVPAMFIGAGIVIVFFLYKITPEVLHEIRTELDARKLKEAEQKVS